ncbi:MAG TPA: helicase HerA-like domain-containing protein, partial [Actinomycetales bacterium]|nr:helicase HerA-like domain-containing protein [Actinomycetales bacterium]
LSETGAPTPVAWTRMRAPQSLMAPAPEADARRIAAASPLLAEYGTAVDRDSAYERLAKRLQTAPAEAEVSPSDPPPPPPPKAEPSVVERMA